MDTKSQLTELLLEWRTGGITDVEFASKVEAIMSAARLRYIDVDGTKIKAELQLVTYCRVSYTVSNDEDGEMFTFDTTEELPF